MSKEQPLSQWPARAQDELPMWTIFEAPADHPDSFVVVQHTVVAGNATRVGMMLADTLEEARALVPGHAVPFQREPFDQPAIRETWL